MSSILEDPRFAIPQRLLPIATVPANSSADAQRSMDSGGASFAPSKFADSDSRSPRATQVFYADHLLRSQSRFRKSQSLEKKSIIAPYYCPYLLIMQHDN